MFSLKFFFLLLKWILIWRNSNFFINQTKKVNPIFPLAKQQCVDWIWTHNLLSVIRLRCLRLDHSFRFVDVTEFSIWMRILVSNCVIVPCGNSFLWTTPNQVSYQSYKIILKCHKFSTKAKEINCTHNFWGVLRFQIQMKFTFIYVHGVEK